MLSILNISDIKRYFLEFLTDYDVLCHLVICSRNYSHLKNMYCAKSVYNQHYVISNPQIRFRSVELSSLTLFHQYPELFRFCKQLVFYTSSKVYSRFCPRLGDIPPSVEILVLNGPIYTDSRGWIPPTVRCLNFCSRIRFHPVKIPPTINTFVTWSSSNYYPSTVVKLQIEYTLTKKKAAKIGPSIHSIQIRHVDYEFVLDMLPQSVKFVEIINPKCRKLAHIPRITLMYNKPSWVFPTFAR